MRIINKLFNIELCFVKTIMQGMTEDKRKRKKKDHQPTSWMTSKCLLVQVSHMPPGLPNIALKESYNAGHTGVVYAT